MTKYQVGERVPEFKRGDGVFLKIDDSGIMLLCVRLVGSLMPGENWTKLGVMTLTGIAVYGGLCLVYWRISGKGIRLSELRRRKG